MMQNEPQINWDSLFAAIASFKINTAVALAVVLFFAVSTAAVTLVAHSELQTTDYEPVLGQSQSGRSQVLGLASYGYNQPVCGRYSANCLNHMLIGFSNGGWQVRIDYQLQKNIVGAIRVNGWPFMDNITGTGSGYTGNDLEPGENYNFVLYRKVGNRLRKLTNLNLTAPPAPEDTQPICLPRPAPPEGCYYDGSDSCGGRLVCSTEPPAYGYQTVNVGPVEKGNWREGWIENISYGSTQAPGSLKISGWAYSDDVLTKPAISLKNIATGVEYFGDSVDYSVYRSDVLDYLFSKIDRKPEFRDGSFVVKFSNLPAGQYQIYNAKYGTSNYAASYLFNVHNQAYQPIYIYSQGYPYGYQTPTADLEIRGVQETSQPNSLMILVCMNGTKSINDLKKENPNVQNFPFNYIVYGANGQKYEFVSNAGGSIEDMKNGQCLNLGTAVQPQHLAHWQATKKITFILDPYNSITESNEYNNQHTYQGEVPTSLRVGLLVNLSGTIVLVGEKGLYGIPNMDIFNSWGWSLTQVVEANQAEKGLKQIGVVPPRSPYCKSALDQIEGQCPVPAKQKITVLSPNGGEAWVKGQEQAVQFSASSSVSGVNIYLKPYYAPLYNTTGQQTSMPEFPPYVLVKDWYFPRPSSLTDTTQSVAVRIDADLAGRNIPEGEYLIQVSGVNGQDLDESDKPFKIASPTSAKPPYIKMTSPNGGEQITLGNQYIITWDTNISSDSPVDIMINKKALGSGGSAYIAKAVPNTGRYMWYTGNGILPLPYSMTQLFSGSDYRVAVSLTAGGPGDDSDGAFSLSAPQQLKSLSNVRLSDSVLYKGQTYRIKWDSADVEKVYIKLRKNSAGDTVETVSQTILNNGYFDWKVPTDLANGSDYVVRVVNGAGNVFADSAAFSIKDETVKKSEELYILLDPASPLSQILPAGGADVTFAVFRLMTTNAGVKVSALSLFNHLGLCEFGVLRLYASGTQIAAVAPFMQNGSCYAEFDNLNLAIPLGYSQRLTLKGDIPALTPAGSKFAWGIGGISVVTTEGNNLSQIVGLGQTVGNTMTVAGTSSGGSGGTSSPSGSSSGGPVESESGSGGGTSASTSSNTSPIPPLRSFRYIKIETPSSNSWIAWREIEVYDAKGSKVTPITATASSVYKENSAERAYDGDVGTVWNSGLYGNGAIVLDLGSDQQISKIRLLPANFPNPASTAHYVRGKSAGGSSFDPITNFSGQIFDNQWLTISL